MRVKPYIHTIFLMVMVTGITASAAPVNDPSAPARKVVMILAGDLALSDLRSADLGRLQRRLPQAAIGLMNTRTAGGEGYASGCLSVGAAARARAASDSGLALEAKEVTSGQEAAVLYKAVTGWGAGASAIVNPGIIALRRSNDSVGHNVAVGLIGRTLRENGHRIAVLGNTDVKGKKQRYACLLAMDEKGLIPDGCIGSSILTSDPDWPYAVRTDYSAMWRRLAKLYPHVSVIVIETGDLFRLRSLAGELNEQAYARARGRALGELDEFIARVFDLTAGEDTLVMLLVPGLPAGGRPQTSLTPVLFFYPDGAGRHFLLRSPTTKRNGLITNMDIAPAVLDHLGLDVPAEAFGAVPRRVDVKDRDSKDIVGLLERNKRLIESTNLLRSDAVKSYILLQMLVFVMTVLVIAVKELRPVFCSRWWQVLLLTVMSVPLSFLLIAYTGIAFSAFFYLAVYGVALVVALAASAFPGKILAPFGLVSGLTGALVVADVLTGGQGMSLSVLGYDLAAGARFYGIGNEYMGVLLGAVITSAAVALDMSGAASVRARAGMWILVAVAFALVAVGMALPQFGANFGGTISAAAGLTITLVWFRSVATKRSVPWWVLGAITASALVIFGGMCLINPQSHVGRLLIRFRALGSGVFVETILRKLAVNHRLILYTIWSRVFLLSLVLVGLVVFFPKILSAQRIFAHHPYFQAGLKGALVTAFAALLANDSGIVAAATVLSQLTPAILYIAGDRYAQPEGG